MQFILQFTNRCELYEWKSSVFSWIYQGYNAHYLKITEQILNIIKAVKTFEGLVHSFAFRSIHQELSE